MNQWAKFLGEIPGLLIKNLLFLPGSWRPGWKAKTAWMVGDHTAKIGCRLTMVMYGSSLDGAQSLIGSGFPPAMSSKRSIRDTS